MTVQKLSTAGKLAVLAWCMAPAGCRDVLGNPTYRLETTSGAPRTAGELSALFSENRADCSQCLTDACAVELEACTNTSGCYEYAECNLDSPSPASELECLNRTHPSELARDQLRSVQWCVRNCITQCGAGSDFRCANEYALPPAPEAASVRLEQTLSFVYGGAVSGARVTICSPDVACQQAIDVTATDTGFYSVEVPVPQSSAVLAGWRGYRLFTAEGMAPHRIQLNVPIWTDRKEYTELLPSWVSDFLTAGLGVPPDQGLVTVQVFDCRGAGAGGVLLELPDAPDAVVHYKDSLSDTASGENTLAVSEGAALITGITPGRFHRVIARRDGQIVGGSDVWAVAGGVSMLAIYPAARKN